MNEKIKLYLKSNKLLYPFVITLIGSLILLITLFTPYASATGAYRDLLNDEGLYFEELNMTKKEAIDLSLFEFGKIYYTTAKMNYEKEISIPCFVSIVVLAVFFIITLIFSILKKPIVISIFNIISLAIFRLITLDFDMRGVVPSSDYKYGYGHYLFYVGIIIVFIGAIYLFIVKRKMKFELKNINNFKIEDK